MNFVLTNCPPIILPPGIQELPVILKDLNNNDVQTGSFILNDGINIEQEVFIKLKDLHGGKIVLKDINGVANQSTSEFMCLIEYF